MINKPVTITLVDEQGRRFHVETFEHMVAGAEIIEYCGNFYKLLTTVFGSEYYITKMIPKIG